MDIAAFVTLAAVFGILLVVVESFEEEVFFAVAFEGSLAFLVDLVDNLGLDIVVGIAALVLLVLLV